MKKLSFVVAAIVLGSVIFSACVKKNYDTPPNTNSIDPNLPVNSSVTLLAKSGLKVTSGFGRVMGDSVLSGVVTADDRSGNFYKQVVIQDTAGAGIVVLIDKTDLYNDYPIGRKIYINLKGLVLANYKGLPEIVYSIDSTGYTTGIPSSLITNYITKASSDNPLIYKDLTTTTLFSGSSGYRNCLVRIKNMQFAAGSAGVLYAQPSTVATGTSLTVKDCGNGATIVMYNSGYATFQPALTPTGNGTLAGIYSWYGTGSQFLIRDSSDVQMTNPRVCQ